MSGLHLLDGPDKRGGPFDVWDRIDAILFQMARNDPVDIVSRKEASSLEKVHKNFVSMSSRLVTELSTTNKIPQSKGPVKWELIVLSVAEGRPESLPLAIW